METRPCHAPSRPHPQNPSGVPGPRLAGTCSCCGGASSTATTLRTHQHDHGSDGSPRGECGRVRVGAELAAAGRPAGPWRCNAVPPPEPMYRALPKRSERPPQSQDAQHGSALQVLLDDGVSWVLPHPVLPVGTRGDWAGGGSGTGRRCEEFRTNGLERARGEGGEEGE